MDRRTRALVVVGLATILASAAAYGVFRAIQTRPVVRVPVASRFVVLASQPVPVGSQLTAAMVRVAGWPADAPVSGGFSKPEEVIGRGVTVGLVENEPIIESKLAPKDGGAGLGPAITNGMRAVSVRVNDVISVAGWVLPGSRVDVIVTMRPGQESISRIVLSNVKVLSTGQNIDTGQSREGKPAQNTPLVTLELTPIDAERIALASNQGEIALALRNPMDVSTTETQGARMSALLGAPAPAPVRAASRGPARAAPPPPPPAPKPQTIEVLSGNQRKETVIKKCPGPGC
jgi:pilus assembly protein CpaB